MGNDWRAEYINKLKGEATAQPELSNNEQTRKNNTAAADALRATRTADVGGTTFGKNRKETNGANMSWWQRLNAHAANAADETFGTYSPGNALGRSKVGNTVASGLQDSGSAFSELIGFLTDQKTDKGLSEADMAFGSLGRNNIAKTDENGKLIAPTQENPAPKSVQKFLQGISDAAYKQSDKLAQESQESRIMAKDGAGTLGSVLVDVGSAGTQMAADIALGRLTGGGLAPLAARATGSAMREARQSGASRQEQFDYAISSAAVEVLTEKIGSVALPFKSVYGKGAIDDVVRDLIKKSAKTPLGRAALSTLAAAVSEGGEEVISDLINPILKKATYDKDALKEYGTDEYWSNLLYDGVIGAALGTVGSGGQVISAVGETSRNANAKKTGSKQSVQPPAQPVDASQIIADMVTGKTGTRSDTAGQNTPQGGTQVNIDNAAFSVALDESTIVNTDPSKHTAVEQRVIDEYQAAVDEGLTKFVSDVTSKRITKQNARYELKPVSDRAAKEIKRITGVDVSGNKTVIEARQVEHIIKRHGKNGNADKSMRDMNDLGRIQYVLDNYDSVSDGGRSEAYSTNKPNGKRGTAKTVVFEKAVNGTYYVVEAVPDTAAKTTYIVSAYMSKKGAKKTAPSSVTGKESPRATPEHARRVAVDGTVSQETENVNPRNEQTLTAAEVEATAQQVRERYEAQYGKNMTGAQQAEMYADIAAVLDSEQSNLPKGTGAAELGFTGEMTAADKWVAEAQGQGDDALHPISEESQRNLAEHQGRAAQEMPRVDLMGKLTSKTASTVMNSGVTSAEMSDAILKDAADGRFSRIAYPDNEAINKAEDEIENGAGRYQGALERWKSAVADGKVSKDNMVMGICLYNNAVTNGDYATALDVLDGIVNLGKNGAQAVQAVRILNKLSPEGRLYVAAKAVDNINAEIQAKYGDRAPDISVDEDLFAEYADALKNGDDAAIREAWAAVEQNIADQIPANWVDKLNNWRYLSMLGNLRTHIRNIFGNAGFMPARMIKNVVGAGIESVVNRASGNGIDRTKSVLNPFSAEDRALIQLAARDYENAIDSIMSGGKYNDNYGGVEDKRTIFKFRPLEAARKFNSTALNAEDSLFSLPAYAESLASWLKANGYDAVSFTDGTMSAAEIDKARDYAIREAQRATYRDTNAFSQWVASMRVRTSSQTLNKASNAVIEGVLPFKKTPANILVRAVDYSPAGLIKTLTADSVRLRRGNITAAEYIDNLAQGLTGTALVGLGALLASLGIVSGGGGDDEQAAFDKLQGKQAYSITIGDWSVSLDWLAPGSMPVFVGVELYNKFADESDEPVSLSEVLDTISNITAPMLDMSMLQGVNDVLEGLDYSNGSALATIATKALGSLASQFFPTIFGQVERVFTPDRQTTFVDRDSDLSPNMQRFLGNLGNKTPGVDFQQIDYIDAWGRTEDTGDVLPRLLNNMLNPANMKKSSVTDVDDELQRLYDSGETGVFPQRPTQNTKIDGEYLTADEYVEYAKTRGSESLTVVRNLINSTAYKRMSDADKAAAIKEAYNYANGIAKQTVRRGTEVNSWIEKAKASGNPAQYITDQSIMKSVDTNGNGSYNNVEQARGLINGGYKGKQLVEKVREYMTSDSGNCALGDYLETAQAAKVPDSVTLNVYEFYSSAKADKDKNGKTISGSKKEKVKKYISSLSGLTSAQKNALYHALYKK